MNNSGICVVNALRSKEEMKVRTILQYGFSHNYGGIEKVFYHIFHSIDKEEFSFEYLVHGTEMAHEKEIEALGGHVHKLPTGTHASRLKNRIYSYKDIFRFLKQHAHTYDVFHYSVVNMNYVFPVVLAAKVYGIPKIVIHAHNSGFMENVGSRAILQHKVERFLVGFFATDFVSVSDQAAAFMFTKRINRQKKYTVMKNPIDIEKFVFNQENRDRIRVELSVQNNFVVGHVGTLSPMKNHTFLLKVFYEIQKEIPDSKLLLVGEGELREEIRKQAVELGIEDKVLFVGVVEDSAPYMHAMDVLVFPSFNEGFGNVLIEAQVAQLPCFASDTVPHEVKVTDMLHFFPLHSNPAEVARKVMQGTKKPKNQTKQIKEEGFSIEDCTKQYEKLYRI